VMSMSGDEFDDELQKSMQEAIADAGRRKVRCIRKTRCARNMTCEYAQIRNETANLEDLYKGSGLHDFRDCENWLARKELNTALDIIRRPNGSGSRHNLHADRDAERRKLLERIERGEGLPNSAHTPEELRNMLIASRRKKGK
jgi:hypothetical protein